jgi:hypothetical protein
LSSSTKGERNLQNRLQNRLRKTGLSIGAGEGNRTLDIQLGKPPKAVDLISPRSSVSNKWPVPGKKKPGAAATANRAERKANVGYYIAGRSRKSFRR